MVFADRRTIQKVRWNTVDDESNATVDSEGALYSPCGDGTTDIYAKNEDGD